MVQWLLNLKQLHEVKREVVEYSKIMAEGGLSLCSLSCTICFDEYKVTKIPKVLPCGHTFCFQCLCKIVADYRCGLCPTCRTQNYLPQSGKVEDFTTNFALLQLVSDGEIQNQNKFKTGQAPIMQGDVAAGLKMCQQHQKPMEFYCKTCKKQVCHQCLLGDHKVGQHCPVPAADEAAHLSHQLQTLTEKLPHEQEKQALCDKINAAILNCQQNKVRLQGVVQQNLEKRIQKLQEDATRMFTQIHEEAEALSHVYAQLQQQYLNTNTLHNQIKENCSTLKQNFQHIDLSQAAELEQLNLNIDKLKNQFDSLKAACQSTPANVGLVINPAKCEMGITLNQVTPQPMILQASDVQNGNNSTNGNNAAEGQARGAVYQYASLPHSGNRSYNFSQAQPLISNEYNGWSNSKQYTAA